MAFAARRSLASRFSRHLTRRLHPSVPHLSPAPTTMTPHLSHCHSRHSAPRSHLLPERPKPYTTSSPSPSTTRGYPAVASPPPPPPRTHPERLMLLRASLSTARRRWLRRCRRRSRGRWHLPPPTPSSPSPRYSTSLIPYIPSPGSIGGHVSR